MSKVRVYELALELGVESKTILTILKDMGEFVRSASSTVEPPVERRLRQRLQGHPEAKRSQTPQPMRPSRRPLVAADRVAAPAVRRTVPREVQLDFPTPSYRGKRHRGRVAPLVQMMLDLDGVTGTPFEDQHEAASARARAWGEEMFEASEVRAWLDAGVTEPSTARIFAARGITGELAQARPWHRVKHDPTKPTILQRVLGGSIARRPEALQAAVEHLRLSGLMT